jgi:hypothetical protein
VSFHSIQHRFFFTRAVIALTRFRLSTVTIRIRLAKFQAWLNLNRFETQPEEHFSEIKII